MLEDKIQEQVILMDEACHQLYDKVYKILLKKGMTADEVYATNLHLYANTTNALSGAIRCELGELRKLREASINLYALIHEDVLDQKTDEELAKLAQKLRNDNLELRVGLSTNDHNQEKVRQAILRKEENHAEEHH